MMTRLPRFKVSFGYICPMNQEKVIFGKLDEKVFSFNDLEFFLKILSPINYTNWLTYVKMLRKGADYFIKFDETTNYGILKKVIKISR